MAATAMHSGVIGTTLALNQEQDPKWLRTDIIAALSDKRFGHDVAQERAWWNGR